MRLKDSMKYYRKRKHCYYFVQACRKSQDIIGIKFFDKKMGEVSVITWGRIFEEKELFDKIYTQCLKQGFKEILSLKICDSLQEVSQKSNFYESWIYFVKQNIPYKHGYKKWVKIKQDNINLGKDIVFLK